MNALSAIRCSGFYSLCLRVFGEVRFPYRFSNFSKRMYGNFVHCFLLIYKERLNVSYRRFVELVSENNLQRMLCIKRIPHFTTLQKFLQRIDKAVFEHMVRACRKLLKLASIEASIDGTGFSNTNPSHYYCKRVDGVKVKNYTKTVFLTDNKTKLILNVKTVSDHTAETKLFKPMITELEDCLRTVIADKGYDSASNRKHCRSHGIEAVIPVRQFNRTRAQEREPSKRYKQTLNKKVYNRRALIESVNSAIKRTLGSYVNSRKASNQQKQVTIKALSYNIEHMARTIKVSILLKLQ